MTDVRGRVGRREEVRTERRRRDDATIDSGQAKKLAIPEAVAAKLQAEGRTPRWINDEGNRIHRLSVLDDYDRVEGVEPIPVGRSEDGKPILSYLYSKPTKSIEEDRAKREAQRRAIEDAAFKGNVPGNNPNPHTVETYADRANKIERGTQSL